MTTTDIPTTTLRKQINRQTSSTLLLHKYPIIRFQGTDGSAMLVQRQGRSTVVVQVLEGRINRFRGEPCGWMYIEAHGASHLVNESHAAWLQRLADTAMTHLADA